ncbi:ras-related protein Rab-26 isoform 1, partial [Danaus plexippus plexippus]
HGGTDDSMSDDVFEEDTLRAPAQRSTPSPTGYRDYRPDRQRCTVDDDMPIHKTILLGDSGVGKTSLLVQFETGKFQPGNFSATVGIGFTRPGGGCGGAEGFPRRDLGFTSSRYRNVGLTVPWDSA